MQILVMGGAGYIGSHTVRYLLDQQYQVVVADNLVTGHAEAVDGRAVLRKADLADPASLALVFQEFKIDAVIHFAAFAYVGESVTDPAKYYHNNVIGTLHLLQAMRQFKVDKIVFSSTCATYGEPQFMPLTEKHPQQPINPYGASKLMIERVMRDYHQAYGLKYIALRYFNAAGASSDGVIGESHTPETHIIPLVLQTLKGEREKIMIFGNDYPTKDGTCVRDYIHVEDLAAAHAAALTKLEEFSGCLNLGTGVGVSVAEVIKAAEEVAGKKCP
ncbi:MAG: UDP-glucose 4-epimerase GalE, partial [Bacteriovoracaceae bacterium]|nr:UDP-glucose 4-epimerase GalE [Bacteriovoracaceae bacterium]